MPLSVIAAEDPLGSTAGAVLLGVPATGAGSGTAGLSRSPVVRRPAPAPGRWAAYDQCEAA